MPSKPSPRSWEPQRDRRRPTASHLVGNGRGGWPQGIRHAVWRRASGVGTRSLVRGFIRLPQPLDGEGENTFLGRQRLGASRQAVGEGKLPLAGGGRVVDCDERFS